MKRPIHRRLTPLLMAAASILLTPGCSRSPGDPATAAQSAFAAHDYASARVHLANALKSNPDDPALLMLQGRVALELGDPTAAAAAFRRITGDARLGADATGYLAKSFMMQGNAKRALDILGETPPATAIGYAAKVGAFFTQGRFDEGLAALDAGLAAFPKSVDLVLLDGSRHNALGDAAKANAAAKLALSLQPDHIEALLFAGRLAMLNGKADAADRHFNRALTLRPGLPTALLALGGMANDRGDAVKAKQYFTQASKSAPGNPVAQYFLAQMAFDAGQTEQARELLGAGAKGEAALPAALMLEGLIAAKRGYHDEAIQKLQTFLSGGGEDGRARLALAAALAAVDEPGKAWAALRPLANSANANGATLQLAAKLTRQLNDPASATFAQRLTKAAAGDPIAKPMQAADAAIRKRDWAAADTIYSDLLAKGNRDNLILLNNASAVKLERGDAAGAVTLARSALALSPNDPMVLDTLGWALFKANGANAEALGFLRRAATAAPNNAVITRHANTAFAARK